MEEYLTNDNHKTSDTLIAYFDILGYKQLLETGFLPESYLIGKIERITNDVYKTKEMPHRLKGVKWHVYSFSDNYTIVVNFPKVGFMLVLSFLIWVLEMIQCQFLSLYGILIRGAITRGEVYAGKNFIYGKGLIEAYEIENKIAVYPRIIINTNLIDDCMKLISELLPEPILFKGILYDPKDINTQNLFRLFSIMILGKVYDSGKIDRAKIDARIERENDEDLVVICKDIDSQYYVDFFQYFLYLDRYPNDFDDEIKKKDVAQESIVDLYIRSFTFHILWYIQKFGSNEHLLKKYLWVCVKANEKFNCLVYNNLFSKTSILETCDINLNTIKTENNELLMLLNLIPNN